MQVAVLGRGRCEVTQGWLPNCCCRRRQASAMLASGLDTAPAGDGELKLRIPGTGESVAEQLSSSRNGNPGGR